MSDYLKPKNYNKFTFLSEDPTISTSDSDGQNNMEVSPEFSGGNSTVGLLANGHGSTAGPRGHHLPGQVAAANMASSTSILATSSGAALDHPPLGQAVLMNPSAAENALLIHQQEQHAISQMAAQNSSFSKQLSDEIEAAHWTRTRNQPMVALELTGLTINSEAPPPLSSTFKKDENSTVIDGLNSTDLAQISADVQSLNLGATPRAITAQNVFVIGAAEDEINTLRDALAQKQHDMNELHKLYADLHTAYSKLASQNSGLDGQGNIPSVLIEQIRQLQKDKATLSTQLQAEKGIVARVVGQNEEQKTQLAELQNRLDQMVNEKEAERVAALATMERLTNELEMLREQHREPDETVLEVNDDGALFGDEQVNMTMMENAVEEDGENAEQESDDESASAPESEYNSSETTTEDERDKQPVVPPSIRRYVNTAKKMDFLRRIQNQDLLEEFRMENQTTIYKIIPDANGDGKQQMIGEYRCNRRQLQEKCKYKILAIQSEDRSFEVFKSGDHNHVVVPSGCANPKDPRSKNSKWVPMQTVRTEKELEILRQANRVNIYKYLGDRKRQFRCYRYLEDRCLFKLMAVTEYNGEIRVFRWDKHRHGAQK